MSRIRVSIIEPVGAHGGMDYYDIGLCSSLCACGVDPTLYTHNLTAVPPNAPFAIRHAFRGIYGSAPAALRAARYLRGGLSSILHSLRTGTRICHFQLFQVGPLEWLSVAAARLAGRKIVVTAHDVEPLAAAYGRSLLAPVCRMAHRVVLHNHTSLEACIDATHVSRERCAIVPHGNYMHALGSVPDSRDARQALGLPPDAPIILFFGQIKQTKGLDVLLKAMPPLLKDHPETRLLIAGKTWKVGFEVYDALIESLGLRDRVVSHVHYIPNDRVGLYYAAADVVAIPYRRIYQSGVLLMAMSYGRPVAASDLPAMRETIENGVDGRLFPPGDGPALAATLSDMLAHPGQTAQLAARAQAKVRTQYAWATAARATADVYRELLSP